MHEFSIAKGIIETALAETEKQRLRLNLSTLLSSARNAAINLTFTEVNRIVRNAEARN
jgi:hypothetical protein